MSEIGVKICCPHCDKIIKIILHSYCVDHLEYKKCDHCLNEFMYTMNIPVEYQDEKTGKFMRKVATVL